MRLVYNRRTGGHIARTLGISKSTVESHLAQARKTLGVTSSVEAAEILHAAEAGDAPCDLTSQPAPVDVPKIEPETHNPWSLPWWQAIAPFRLSGKRNNDLSVRYRLGWIAAIALGIALGLGAVADLLRSVGDIVARQ